MRKRERRHIDNREINRHVKNEDAPKRYNAAPERQRKPMWRERKCVEEAGERNSVTVESLKCVRECMRESASREANQRRAQTVKEVPGAR